jgi:hypothetical protein
MFCFGVGFGYLIKTFLVSVGKVIHVLTDLRNRGGVNAGAGKRGKKTTKTLHPHSFPFCMALYGTA